MLWSAGHPAEGSWTGCLLSQPPSRGEEEEQAGGWGCPQRPGQLGARRGTAGWRTGRSGGASEGLWRGPVPRRDLHRQHSSAGGRGALAPQAVTLWVSSGRFASSVVSPAQESFLHTTVPGSFLVRSALWNSLLILPDQSKKGALHSSNHLHSKAFSPPFLFTRLHQGLRSSQRQSSRPCEMPLRTGGHWRGLLCPGTFTGRVVLGGCGTAHASTGAGDDVVTLQPPRSGHGAGVSCISCSVSPTTKVIPGRCLQS